MTDAAVGRLLVASNHQAVMELGTTSRH